MIKSVCYKRITAPAHVMYGSEKQAGQSSHAVHGLIQETRASVACARVTGAKASLVEAA
jgi:hypothetical protein